MTRKTAFYIAGGLVIGIFYSWFNEYNEPEVWGVRVRTLMMTGSSILAFLLCYLDDGKVLPTVLKIAAGVTLAVLMRIVWDTVMIDKTMHNLAPFELVMAFGLSFITSLLGGGVAALVRPKRANT